MFKVRRREPELTTLGGRWLFSEITGKDIEPKRNIKDQRSELALWHAAFELAVRSAFDNDTPVAEISAFAQRMHDRFKPEFAAIPPIDSEALIRAALGEDLDIEAIKPRHRGLVYVVVLSIIVKDKAISDTDLRRLLATAENVARERGFTPE
ncbi:hypothetical protein AB0M47_36345 [Hamadaea sp. NPDC051192]|uniref:hypothetical protein n=1 Tax=Hamadaea sp. NPDC051192 TaxID=3154940 RepID=UPI00341EA5FB